MIKKSKEAANGSRDNEGPQFRDNPEINAKIDDYIKQNPKHWAYIHSMPAERMARALVLNEVQRRDRTQNMRKGILRKLEQDPELKQAYQTLVKNLPEDQREQAMVTIAARTMRNIPPHRAQRAGAKG